MGEGDLLACSLSKALLQCQASALPRHLCAAKSSTLLRVTSYPESGNRVKGSCVKQGWCLPSFICAFNCRKNFATDHVVIISLLLYTKVPLQRPGLQPLRCSCPSTGSLACILICLHIWSHPTLRITSFSTMNDRLETILRIPESANQDPARKTARAVL